MRRIFVVGLCTLAGCLSTSTEWVRDKQKTRQYRVVGQGYVIEAAKIEDPKTYPLKDGKAYVITKPGSTVVLEFQRKRRQRFELKVGDVFVHGRPYSFVLEYVGEPKQK